MESNLEKVVSKSWKDFIPYYGMFKLSDRATSEKAEVGNYEFGVILYQLFVALPALGGTLLYTYYMLSH